jgi:hypothetical protein
VLSFLSIFFFIISLNKKNSFKKFKLNAIHNSGHGFYKSSCETWVDLICRLLNNNNKMSSWKIKVKPLFYWLFVLFLNLSSQLSHLKSSFMKFILNTGYARSRVKRFQGTYLTSLITMPNIFKKNPSFNFFYFNWILFGFF